MLISIIIPCFNASSTLERCLSSVIPEATEEVEIIIIDDGSSDTTYLDLLSYQEKKPQIIKLFKNECNYGVSYSRNKGMEQASGEYIIFLDADDYYKEGFVSELLYKIKENPSVDMFSFSFLKKGKSHEYDKSYSNELFDGCLFSSDKFIKLFLLKDINQCICSFATRLSTLRKNDVNFHVGTNLGEDVEFQIKAMFFSQKIFYSSTDVFFYEYNISSVTNSMYSQKHVSFGDIYFRLKKLIILNNRVNLLPYVNFYYSYTYFFVLRGFLLTKNVKLIDAFMRYDKLLKDHAVINLVNRKTILIYLAKKIYRINQSFLLLMLKKVFK